MLRILATAISAALCLAPVDDNDLQPLQYNHPGLQTDLGVGLWAWPLPMDFDGDGDADLAVVCPDKPHNGTWLFENPGGPGSMPVFRKARRISGGLQNVQVSYVDGQPHVLSPGRWHHEFLTHGLAKSRPLGVDARLGLKGKLRANQWKRVDFDADGRLDLLVGIGDWTAYGWDDAWDENGKWTNGPLHGYVYLVRNTGTTEKPAWAAPVRLQARSGSDSDPTAMADIDVYGWPSPNYADFDNDGDNDLLCGEFLDGFTWSRNIGTREAPVFAAGRRLITADGTGPLKMDLQMIVPVAFDWNRDGHTDLIVGDEDGRVAFVEHTGRVADGMPLFKAPQYFRQQAADIKFGALATPCGFDWDGDGDDDIICGNTAGYIGFIENLGGTPPKWAAPVRLQAAGSTIRIQAGPNGSIQGPCEARWGYTTQTVGDWDHDGLPDIVANSIWGRVIWFRNVGTRQQPQLAAAQPMEVAWPGPPPKPEWNWWNPAGNELVTQWRTTPVVVDFDRDGLNDLVMLDHEGYLALFRRTRSEGQLRLLPGERIFVDEAGSPIRLNAGRAGRSGRRKLCVVDWDGDGRADVLANAENAELWRNVRDENGHIVLHNEGLIARRNVAGHTSSPTVIDLDQDGRPELLVGAEDGRLYHLPRH